ncbi:MAG: GNAT family N-acetyltransferase, partial [Calditrichaeota bacterium]|nr:GNAT family N-acetyltransferase [Calditrichota bacterium]
MNDNKSDFVIQLVPDKNVSAALDRQLLELLIICFPHESVFATQRFLYEKPKYRWCVFSNQTQLVAHTALHIKTIKTESGKYGIGGIAEVCVHPEFRRKGLVRAMMDKVDALLISEKISFSMLFGEGKIYRSSGYFEVKNKIRRYDPKT